MEQNIIVQFCVGQLSDGRFVAATNSAPFFCFRAETEESVIIKAEQALQFYFDWKTRSVERIDRFAHADPKLNTWKNSKVVELPRVAA